MSTNRFQVTPRFIQFWVDAGETATVTNIGSSTVYGGADEMFPTTADADWTLAAGESRTEDGGSVWVRTADSQSSTLTVEPIASGTAIDVGSGAPISVGSGGGGVILPWATDTEYVAGQPVTSEGRTYTAIDDHTAGATFDADRTAHWTQLPVFGGRLEIIEGRDVWTFGHSYVAGSGGGAFPLRFSGRHNTGTYTTRAVAGTTAGGASDQIRQVALSSNGASGGGLFGLQMIMSLINDANSSHPVATVTAAYRAIFAQLWGLRLGITTSAFAFGPNWTSGVTTTVGSYFDFSWVGDTAYLLMAHTTGATVSMTVKDSGNGGATTQTVNTGGYAYAFPGVIKLSGYGSGNHTVRVTLDSGAGATVYYGLFENPSKGTVVWCAEGAIPSYSGAQNTLMTATYRDAVAALLADFSNVVPVYADEGWDQATMIYSDNVHLNDRGILYWMRRVEEELSTLAFRQGQNALTVNAAPAYNTPLPSATASYTAATVDQSTDYTLLKTWASDGHYIYSLGTDLPATFPVGGGVIITAGTGWTPGTYQVIGVNAAFGTPDGARNMYQLRSTPGPLGNLDVLPAVAGTAGGTGRLSL